MPNAIIIHLQEKTARLLKRLNELKRETTQRTKVSD